MDMDLVVMSGNLIDGDQRFITVPSSSLNDDFTQTDSSASTLVLIHPQLPALTPGLELVSRTDMM